jgi:hypothetical protein
MNGSSNFLGLISDVQVKYLSSRCFNAHIDFLSFIHHINILLFFSSQIVTMARATMELRRAFSEERSSLAERRVSFGRSWAPGTRFISGTQPQWTL